MLGNQDRRAKWADDPGGVHLQGQMGGLAPEIFRPTRRGRTDRNLSLSSFEEDDRSHDQTITRPKRQIEAVM